MLKKSYKKLKKYRNSVFSLIVIIGIGTIMSYIMLHFLIYYGLYSEGTFRIYEENRYILLYEIITLFISVFVFAYLIWIYYIRMVNRKK